MREKVRTTTGMVDVNVLNLVMAAMTRNDTSSRSLTESQQNRWRERMGVEPTAAYYA